MLRAVAAGALYFLNRIGDRQYASGHGVVLGLAIMMETAIDLIDVSIQPKGYTNSAVFCCRIFGGWIVWEVLCPF